MLTPRQIKLFNFLKKYKEENNYMPTFREIKKHMNLKSISTVHKMIGYLEFKGYIKRIPAMARALEIIKEYK